MADAKQRVIKAGGLCVIGTSFFIEPKTEQQTRGRSGRQGEIGESIIFRSIKDDGLREIMSKNKLLYALTEKNPDIKEMDSKILKKSIEHFQKASHSRVFAKIRSNNDLSTQIEAGRAVFIRARNDLLEGVISPDDLIRDWAKDKTVQDRINLLKKAEGKTKDILLADFYSEYSDKLSSAKGRRLEQALFDAFKEKVMINAGDLQGLRHMILWSLFEKWKKYIEIVNDTVGYVDMNNSAKVSFFDKERHCLYIEAIENLQRIRIKRKPGDNN